MSYVVGTGAVGFYRGQDHPGGVPVTLCGVPAVFRLVEQVKGRSSRLLRQEFHTLRSGLPPLWTNC